MKRATLILAIAFATVGCMGPGASAAPDSSGEPTQSDTTPPEASPAMTDVQLPAAILDPIIDEVARDAGIPRDAVVLNVAEAVTFPNGGLGCPEPGMAYKQVPVDGYRVVLEAGGTTYDYRGTGSQPARRCRTVIR